MSSQRTVILWTLSRSGKKERDHRTKGRQRDGAELPPLEAYLPGKRPDARMGSLWNCETTGLGSISVSTSWMVTTQCCLDFSNRSPVGLLMQDSSPAMLRWAACPLGSLRRGKWKHHMRRAKGRGYR